MEFSSVNTIWVLVGAALVFFMQAGFRHGRDRFYPGNKRRQHHYDLPFFRKVFPFPHF